jgi:hypothetical protein
MIDPGDVAYMEDSHLCDGCGFLIIEITYNDGEREDTGCRCELGGEA